MLYHTVSPSDFPFLQHKSNQQANNTLYLVVKLVTNQTVFTCVNLAAPHNTLPERKPKRNWSTEDEVTCPSRCSQHLNLHPLHHSASNIYALKSSTKAIKEFHKLIPKWSEIKLWKSNLHYYCQFNVFFFYKTKAVEFLQNHLTARQANKTEWEEDCYKSPHNWERREQTTTLFVLE